MNKSPLDQLLNEIRACSLCAKKLPLGPNPILSASENSKILVVGQAPGTRVHASGIPWNDPSGDRLRTWMDLSPNEFYDPNKLAIVPMGFCYPGKGKSGDLPPMKECSQTWHHLLIPHLTSVRLTIVIGQYAIGYFLSHSKKNSLTETVKKYADYLPSYFPLVHPSPRNIGWLKKNPWFEKELLPVLRSSVKNALI